MIRLCLAFLIIAQALYSLQAQAYPEFIGYKYASCITCHFNGQGNGPINDYGRALWAAEIAGRAFAGGRSDEQLGEASGFFGSKQLPWWIRPGIKVRQLQLQRNPGALKSDNRRILMQADANLAVFFDRDQRYAVVGTFGYAPDPSRFRNSTGQEIDNWISREHYLRWQAKDSLWIYGGMLDKVYGIRHANHVAYSRAKTGLAQNDQAHSVIAHYIQPKWELTGDVFAGNLYQDEKLRQMGASTMFEYEVKDVWRLGASLLASKNDFISNERLGVHSKVGYGNGSALLFETGLIRNTPKGSQTKSGYYIYSEVIQKVTRGYHLFVTGEAYKEEMKNTSDDLVRMGFGLLAFPMQRVEFRFEGLNEMSFPTGVAVADDQWSFLGQIHLSL